VAADAVGRLQRGGVREEELRGEGAERLLRDLGVPLGARRAILTRFGGGGGLMVRWVLRHALNARKQQRHAVCPASGRCLSAPQAN
jgi:hypothetical protein